jgi:glyoxylase-like metal-dependent hydrolase (beta-lactamase superfamily II)
MQKIAPNVYAETAYPGVNVGFVVTPLGAIAIDAPTLPHGARAWRQKVIETARGPILYVILTDAHPDRMLSVGLLEAPVVAARAAYEQAAAYTDGTWRGAIENWARMHPEATGGLPETPIVLPEIMFSDSLTLHKGGVSITVRCVAGGAPGSAWVYLPDQDVLFTGDTLVVETHPFLADAPDTRAWLETLKALRQPRFANTTIVPGRGPVCNQSATRPLSEYIALVRRRARSLRAVGQARADKTAVIAELLPLFPVADDEQESVQRRIRAGLDKLCEEVQEDSEDG